jgi:hypothetical protein
MNEEKFIAKNHCLKDFPKKNETLFGKVRSYIFEKYGFWDAWDLFPYSWRMTYYDKIRPIIKPQNQRIRKAIPRTWVDVTEMVVSVNFEFIKAFYEEEFKADIVDWEATEHHKEFAEWLEKAYEYVTKIKPQLEIDLQNAYPPSKPIEEMFERIPQEDGTTRIYMKDDGIPYEVKYKDVNRIEEEIKNRDTEVLTELIKRREYFWT